MKGSDMAWYLAGMGIFATTVGGITWLITAQLGASQNTQLIVSTQAPVIGVLLLWIAALVWGHPK